MKSKVAAGVEELVDSPMGAAGMACLNEWSKGLAAHGVVSAAKAEGFELMARFARDVLAVQAVDASKREVDGVSEFGIVSGERCRVEHLDAFRWDGVEDGLTAGSCN